MKKTFFSLALFFAILASAQKGTFLVSGNVSYYSDKNSENNFYDYQYFDFNPKFGYQFSDNWTIGVESSFNENKSIYTNSENKKNNFSVGSFIRYSKSLGNNFSLFADFGVGYKNSKEVFSYDFSPGSIVKYNGFYTTLNPIVHLKIKNSFGMNFGLGGISYNSITNQKTNNKRNTFNINFGQAYTIGVQKNF